MTQGYCSTYLNDHESVLGIHPEGHCNSCQALWGEDEGKDIVAVFPVLGKGKPTKEENN